MDRVHKRLQSDSILTFINAFSLLSSSFYKQSGDTLDKVRGIISEQLGTDLDAVAADSKFVDLGADSLDTVEIMMALEEQFEITLDEEGAEKIGTVQEAADMIQTQIDACVNLIRRFNNYKTVDKFSERERGREREERERERLREMMKSRRREKDSPDGWRRALSFSFFSN